MTSPAITEFNYWKETLKNDLEVQSILKEMEKDPVAVEKAFGSQLAFGTGGIRAIMGVGSSKMNRYTMRRINSGVAYWVRSQHKKITPPLVVIGYDGRHGSQEFAFEAARLFATHQIRSYVFPEPTATPWVSYAIREMKADIGIMITASHNPKEYNGYKLYGANGHQLLDKEASDVISWINNVNDYLTRPLIEFDPKAPVQPFTIESSWITLIPETFLTKCFESLANSFPLIPGTNPEIDYNVLYTPLHGVGGLSFNKVLAHQKVNGFCDYVPLEDEINPDFKHVKSANPEEDSAFLGALALIEKEKERYKNLDIIIANDPDADRVGIMMRNQKGEFFRPNGNELALLLYQYVKLSRGDLKGQKNYVIKSIVTHPGLEDGSCKVINTAPGFKYIGQQMQSLIDSGTRPDSIFIGAEESYGYLIASHAREKDGITAAIGFIKLGMWLKTIGKTADQLLCDETVPESKFWQSKTISLELPKDEQIRKELHAHLLKCAEKPIPLLLDDQKVTTWINCYAQPHPTLYSLDKTTNQWHTKEIWDHFPRSLMVIYRSEKCEFIFRTSGTEPKMKVYMHWWLDAVQGKSLNQKEITQRFDNMLKHIYTFLGIEVDSSNKITKIIH